MKSTAFVIIVYTADIWISPRDYQISLIKVYITLKQEEMGVTKKTFAVAKFIHPTNLCQCQTVYGLSVEEQVDLDSEDEEFFSELLV